MRYYFSAVLLLFVFFVSIAFAQDAPSPKIACIYPAGGKAGTTFEVLIGGRQLGRSGAIHFSGSGVQGKILNGYGSTRINNGEDRQVAVHLYYEALERFDPSAVSPEQKRINAALKKKIEESHKNSANKTETNTGAGNNTTNLTVYPSFESITRRFPYFDRLKQATPEVLETVYDIYFAPRADRFSTRDLIPMNLIAEITIDADAQPGIYELRLMGANGLSTPARFYVDKHPEVMEREPNDFAAKPNQTVPEPWGRPNIEPPSRYGIQEIHSTPIVFNGRIRAGDVDRFTFRATGGQKLVLAVKARALMPYLADAVPGWFQAVLSLYNSDGKKIAESASYRFDPDPVIFFDVPATGVYAVEIRDSIYRGREDFVYRISVAETPMVTSVFPAGGQIGSPTGVDIDGRNLPVKHTVLPTDRVKTGIHTKKMLEGLVLTEPILFAADSLPEYIEKESIDTERYKNNTLKTAEKVSLPVIINGKINSEGDEDYYVFTGERGQKIVLDVTALSVGSALDSTVQLLDEYGAVIAENDDRADSSGPNIGLETHHADPYLTAVLPQAGKYTVRIFSTISKDGVGQSYRLRISEPMPDFSVYVEPSALNFRNGKCNVTAHIVSKDGFDGEVKFRLVNDFSLFSITQSVMQTPAENKPEEDKSDEKTSAEKKLTEEKLPVKDIQLTLTAAQFWRVIPLEIEAVAEVNGKRIVRNVVPADDYEQAFIYHHWVPAKQLPAVFVRSNQRR
ncbi:MAG: pre-peptidase C-terminal domain-containing protein [Planctomycetaceae bacterium]|nr:pre-peptidase C-terminal domain-containing protein [Planctomycetaceae bacterium]